MNTTDQFRGYSPAEVAEMTTLYSESELRKLAAAGKVQHTRGARNRIVFFPDDVKALIRARRRTPAAPVEPALALVPDAEDDDPFRSTSRSRALHSGRRA